MPTFISRGGNWVEPIKIEEEAKMNQTVETTATPAIVEPIDIKPVVEKPKKPISKKTPVKAKPKLTKKKRS